MSKTINPTSTTGTNNLPKGYICVCGAFNQFAVWVFAHWGIKLIHTCDKCGQRNIVIRGVRIK